MIFSAIQIQITFGLPPNEGGQGSVSPVSGAIGAPQATAAVVTTEPHPDSAIQFNSQIAVNVSGMLASPGRAAGPETGIVYNSQVGLSVGSPPPQALTQLDSDGAGTASLLARGEASLTGNRLVAAGSGGSPRTSNAQAGAGIKSRPPLFSTMYLSAGDLKDAQPDTSPRPGSADLLVSALPFDRGAITRALDQFFERFDDVNAGELVPRSPALFLSYAVALSSTFAALEIVRRRWLHAAFNKENHVRNSLLLTEQMGFPELPGS